MKNPNADEGIPKNIHAINGRIAKALEKTMSNSFQNNPNEIAWKVHFKSSPEKVYAHLATDTGRAAWWAESAIESDQHIDFLFDNEISWRGEIVARTDNKTFAVNYFGSVVTFELNEDGAGGTDLDVHHAIAADDPDRRETEAGWVSALLAMKAAVDHQIDLRNHDAKRSWLFGFCDN